MSPPPFFFLRLSPSFTQSSRPPLLSLRPYPLFLPFLPLICPKMHTQQRQLTEQERIDQATMRIDNPNVAIVGSGEEGID